MLFNRQRLQGFLVALAFFAAFAAGYVVNETADAQAATIVAFTADGIVHSSDGGFQFPDGTLQTTAAGSSSTQEELLSATRRLSVNQGLYDNRISDFTHDRAYVEVCFKGGAAQIDENDAGTDTGGGSCEPGDVGWILERDERSAVSWTVAKAACLKLGMRLPAIFEYQWTCDQAPTIGIVDMTDNREWVSNEVEPRADNSFTYLGAAILGNGSCDHGTWRAVARTDGNRNIQPYRCAL